MKMIKQNLTVMNVTLALVILICAVFFAGVISQSTAYNRAIDDIAAGRYERARERLCSIDEGYRDRDRLIEFIDIITEYDPRDPVSIYHSYRTLNFLCFEMEEGTLDSGIGEACSDMGMLYNTLGAGQGLG